MIGDKPIEKGEDPVKVEGLPRVGGTMADVPVAPASTTPAATPRPLGVRRISFTAWGLAGATGVALWALIFKIIF
jgi:hypothetical protein